MALILVFKIGLDSELAQTAGFVKIFQIKMFWPSIPLLKLQTGKDFYKCPSILRKFPFKDLEFSAAKVVRI